MKKFILSTFVLSFIFNIQTVFAWGKTGHRVVAQIAEQNLSKKAKKQIMKITGGQSLVYRVNHPDFLKSDSEMAKTTSSWHYNNFPEGMNRAEFDSELAKSGQENLYKRALILIDLLKNRNDFSQEEQNRALFFLTHMIGDAHQPLHMGREADLGGNRIRIKWFDQDTNLHSLWDDELVDFQKYSYSEFSKILDYRGKTYNQNLISGGLEDWLYDSYQKASFIYSGVNIGDSLKYRYDFDHVDLLEEQLLKAGLRLAKVLNEIFG